MDVFNHVPTFSDAGPFVLLPAIIYGIYFLTSFGSRERGLPPGPPTKPLIGNLDIFPTGHIHLQFLQWAKIYGDVFSLKLMNKTMIILNNPTLVKEIIDKRSLSSSNRPKSIILDKLIPHNMNLGAGRFANETWRVLRKSSAQLLNADNFRNFKDYQYAEATQLMWDLAQNPTEWYNHIHRYTTSFAMGIVYGKRSPSIYSSDMKEFFSTHHKFLHAMNIDTMPPVDLFPVLNWVPEYLVQWKKTVTDARISHEALYYRLLSTVRQRREEGRGNGCFLEQALENSEEWGLTSDELLMNLGAVLIQGSDTSSAAMQNLLLCLVAFPDAQAKAREEIDKVVGSERAPRWDDLVNLPYTMALVEEANRFRPVGPLGLPHEMVRDEVVDGFLYPKDAVVWINIYAIFHDERYFDKPNEFIPERFLKHPYGVMEAVLDDPARRANLFFGGGRRVCPGITFAKSSLELNLVNLVWAFNLLPSKDPITGCEVLPNLDDYSTGVTATPKPTPVRIELRSEKHMQVMTHQFATVAEVLAPYEQELSQEDAHLLKEARNF
ncbi:cytochrome P450 [Collybia nuda]|uniref:Cytochrome P450 n=1 Tax=Collybia nuda TaxID=64659 RepID=A0A9P5XTC6_9AGAR|nr:cytochrome P450 [Collybia nuda]